MKNDICTITIREFLLMLENDGRLHTQRIAPIVANLQRKQAKGIYDTSKAVKLVQYAVDDYERANAVAIAGRRLTKAERAIVACELLESLENTYELKGANGQ
ncbi:hypothetical protein UFOVP453_40 [uncultured Caudovirales phage]|uniref:Uncharacterized protein n=1 Tax=uncultured Caudovirales phage TaxID=2100421 RepID=A0A6J5MBM8_9CAUD|nr:hypothetical protein UFOVP453_40 [uncultured Caudovirales phage]